MKLLSLPQRENMIHRIHDKQRNVRLSDAADSKQLMLAASTVHCTMPFCIALCSAGAFGWFGLLNVILYLIVMMSSKGRGRSSSMDNKVLV